MRIGSLDMLRGYLSDAQARGESRITCELTREMTDRVTDAQLTEALATGLPMAQGIQRRILRSRGRGTILTAKVRWREGVRMLESSRRGLTVLTDAEADALEIARSVAAEAAVLADEAARLRYVFEWVCRNVRYVNTAPGQKGYERLVGACGALLDGQANCQGFADVMYLLCGLCGIEAAYRCGRGEKQLHVWNMVRVDGTWREADASRAARGKTCSAIDKSKTNFCIG